RALRCQVAIEQGAQVASGPECSEIAVVADHRSIEKNELGRGLERLRVFGEEPGHQRKGFPLDGSVGEVEGPVRKEWLSKDVTPLRIVLERDRRAAEVACSEANEAILYACIVRVQPGTDGFAGRVDHRGIESLDASEIVENERTIGSKGKVGRVRIRSEERRVGKECRAGWSWVQYW